MWLDHFVGDAHLHRGGQVREGETMHIVGDEFALWNRARTGLRQG